MGALRRFKLDKFVHDFKLDSFFETGSFKGDGIQVAVDSGFKNIISTEIMDTYFDLCTKRFSSCPQVKIAKGNSFDLVPELLEDSKSATFFWLDAHFPGADGGINDYNAELNEEVKYPLERELEQIKNIKNINQDVFLIDDLRMYEDGNYEKGNMPSSISRPQNRNINFVFKTLESTHTIIRLYQDEGYILCIPKTIPCVVTDFINEKEETSILKRVLKKIF